VTANNTALIKYQRI